MPRSAGDRVERGAAPLSTQGSRGARLLERGSQRGVLFGRRCRSGTAPTREFHRGARPPLGRGARGGTPLPSRAANEAGSFPPGRAAHYRAWLANTSRKYTLSLSPRKKSAAKYRPIKFVGKVGQLPSPPAHARLPSSLPREKYFHAGRHRNALVATTAVATLRRSYRSATWTAVPRVRNLPRATAHEKMAVNLVAARRPKLRGSCAGRDPRHRRPGLAGSSSRPTCHWPRPNSSIG
jgi:hypothetical protein